MNPSDSITRVERTASLHLHAPGVALRVCSSLRLGVTALGSAIAPAAPLIARASQQPQSQPERRGYGGLTCVSRALPVTLAPRLT